MKNMSVVSIGLYTVLLPEGAHFCLELYGGREHECCLCRPLYCTASGGSALPSWTARGKNMSVVCIIRAASRTLVPKAVEASPSFSFLWFRVYFLPSLSPFLLVPSFLPFFPPAVWGFFLPSFFFFSLLYFLSASFLPPDLISASFLPPDLISDSFLPSDLFSTLPVHSPAFYFFQNLSEFFLS